MRVPSRYVSMRRTAFIAALAFIAGACGSSDQNGALPDDTVEPVATTTTVPGEAPPEVDADDDIGGSTTTTNDIPQIVQSDDESLPGPFRGDGMALSIDDGLLEAAAFPAPWEPQWRNLDRIGFDAGPNQTDCATYWEYESLLGGEGGHAMWWIDGGNANHYVERIRDEGALLASIVALGTIATDCPVVTWNEGGSFTTEFFDLGDAVGLRFVDDGSGEITWVAVTAFGDLVSVLQVPLWTRADGTMVEFTVDDLSALGSEMLDRLERAGPAELPPPTTLPTTQSTSPPTTGPPVATTTRPPTPTTTVLPTGLATLLPTADELPAGWTFDGLDEYDSGSTDEALVEACPAAASMDRIDLGLEWEADYLATTHVPVVGFIGEMDSTEAAVAAVREFALVSDCDLTVIFPDGVGSGGSVDVPGADAASTLILESPDLSESRLELLVGSVGSVIVVVTAEASMQHEPAATVLEFATATFAKIAAARG